MPSIWLIHVDEKGKEDIHTMNQESTALTYVGNIIAQQLRDTTVKGIYKAKIPEGTMSELETDLQGLTLRFKEKVK